jgi:hypothetical protein
MSHMRHFSLFLATFATVVTAAGSAHASQLIDRNASNVHLGVDNQGRALLSYRAHGKTRRVLAWGAVDARQPDSPNVPQVEFKLDYSGKGAAGFRNTCGRYDGPALAWAVTACKAKDGTYWAVQRWQRMLPNAGYKPWKAAQTVQELRLSHWTASGGVALFDVHVDWVYGGRFHDLFGRVTYQGQAVHGFKTTKWGVPLDSYGRNLYLDTLSSAYGTGWHRENSFVAHNPSGMFCYGFYPYGTYPGYPAQRSVKLVGAGKKYRITMIGPGVSPDVMWAGDGLQDFDAKNAALTDWERQMNAKLDEMRAAYGEKSCGQH